MSKKKQDYTMWAQCGTNERNLKRKEGIEKELSLFSREEIVCRVKMTGKKRNTARIKRGGTRGTNGERSENFKHFNVKMFKIATSQRRSWISSSNYRGIKNIKKRDNVK